MSHGHIKQWAVVWIGDGRPQIEIFADEARAENLHTRLKEQGKRHIEVISGYGLRRCDWSSGTPASPEPRPVECPNSWHKWPHPDVDKCPACGAEGKSLSLRVTKEETNKVICGYEPTECYLFEDNITGGRVFRLSWHQPPEGPVEKYHVIVGLGIITGKVTVLDSCTFLREDLRLKEGVPEEYEDLALRYIQYYFRMGATTPASST